MTAIEYFILMLKKEALLDNSFLFTVFSLPSKQTENNYYKYEKNKYYVKTDNGLIEISDRSIERPIFLHTDKLTVTKDILPNVDKPTESTVGMVLLNYLLLVYPFTDKIAYMNKISIGDIEDIIVNRLEKEYKGLSPITIPEYVKFVDACKYVETLSSLFVISLTDKSILPPPGIDKKKKELRDKYIKEYGKEAFKDSVIVGKFEEELIAIDREWMKDDPTYGILTNDKIMTTVRPKLFLTIGSEVGFDGEMGAYVENSLKEGWPKDPEQLASMFNGSRLGSYSRGVETMYGGLLAKIFLRATNAITIEDHDCKTKKGITVDITKDNYKGYVNRYKLDNTILTEDILSKSIGSRIVIRSPRYCKEPNNNFCKYCMSEELATKKNGIAIVVTDVANTILNSSLKKMHNNAISLVKVNIPDLLK